MKREREKRRGKICRWAIEWKHVSSQLQFFHFGKRSSTITTYNLTRRQMYESTSGSCHFVYLQTRGKMVFCIETQTLYSEHRILFFFLLLNNSTFRCIWIHFDPKWNQTRFISIDELYIFLRDNYMVAPSLRRASWWWYLIILGSQMSQNHLPRFATRSIMVIMRRRSLAHAHPHYGNGHYLINCIFQMQTDAFPCCFVLFSLWRRFIGRRRQYASDWFFCG